MNRTSLSHPLQIAALSAGPGLGRIGVTFCPGKVQSNAVTGAWTRDLALDIRAISDWGAVAVVTLVEQHELESLQVTTIGEAVQRHHMDWLHVPIRDVDVPTPSFEEAWISAGENLRARLRAGFDIVVHCKGGLGRAGTVAARLLTELGWNPDDAIAAVRIARPGALETKAQEAHVRALPPVAEAAPSQNEAARRDRARGALIGLALGDAVGTTLEFKARDTYPPLTDLVGGGPFRLLAGQWTDDTAMALALAESLKVQGRLDEQDLLARFSDWRDNGAYSCTGHCFDIGITTAQALSRWKRTGEDHCGSSDPNAAGNGSLMRLAPVAIRYWNDRPNLRDAAARQSRTTHAADEAVDACVFYAERLADAIEGQNRSGVLRPSPTDWSGAIDGLAKGGWRGKARSAINASGYVAHSLDAALWSVGRAPDFDRAILHAANLAQDADTTAAIAGQLAGALSGYQHLPTPWLEKLAWRQRLVEAADALFDASIA